MAPPPTLQGSSTTLSAGSESSGKMDAADQKEIEAIWSEVHAKVVELAGGDPKKVRQSLSIEDVLGYIDKVQKVDAEKAEEYGTFKNIVSKTLQCISTVGGIVADGVSDVFAPAGMCYNALTFVIQAWQGYEGTFANLAELLDKCVEFFERLQSYQGRMDSRLTRLASQNLRLFVEICDRTIKLRKKHTRFLRFTKQLFLNDDGVQDLLGMMEKLNSKEALLVNAQTYRLVSDSAGEIKMILETQKEQRREDDAKKWRRSIAKALGFPGTTLDNDGEPVPLWQRAFEARLNQLVEGTGAWWKTEDAFAHWATARYPEQSTLVLSGAGGTGKTSMMANTIRSIRRLGSEAPSTRVVAAYYFADGDKRKPDDDDESPTIERVSRTLLWQIATSYEAMTKSVASTVERASHFEDALDRWDQLFFSNKERRNSSTTFYIFIDGYHDELIKLLQRFSALSDRAKVRVFLTARPELLTGHVDNKLPGVAYAEVPIARRNSDDVEKYIECQMNSMSILRDTTRPGISEWRDVIKKDLRDKCAGDYFTLNTSLAALAKVDLIEDIREVLKDAGKPRADQIRAELRRLNNTRTLKEIREINEIILWIDTGKWFFSVDEMDAILSVKHREPSFALPSTEALPSIDQPPVLKRQASISQAQAQAQAQTEPTVADEPALLSTISLLPLAQKLREKYPLFSITDSGVIDWRNPEIRTHVPTKEGQHDDDSHGTTSLQVIRESEISIVRHFLATVCPGDLYKRFEFEEFFRQRLGAGLKEYIHLDPDNADLKIAYTCLIILTDEELRHKDNLRRYAMYWLLQHLSAVDLSAADRDLKAKIGPLLVRLFTEDCGIDSLFWPFAVNVSMKTWNQGEATYLREARIEWVYSTAGVGEIARWLNDSAVTKNITDSVGRDFVAAVKAPKVNLHEAILQYAARHMANHLFLRTEFLKRHFLAASCFLRGYLARVDGSVEMPNDAGIYRDEEDEVYKKWESNEFPLSALAELESWAASVLPDARSTPSDESLWEIHGALIAFQLCDNEEDKAEVSLRRAKKALELNPQNWHACHFVSARPSTSPKDGVELLTRAKQSVDDVRAKDQDWMSISANTALLARITLDLGNKLWEQGDYAAAASTHRESLGYNYVHFSAYAKVLGSYQEREQWGELVAFVETLNKTSHIWDAYYDELVNELVGHLVENNPDLLAQAADATNRWDAVVDFFKIGEEIGGKQEAYDLLFLLRDGFAKTLEFTSGAVDESSVINARVAALESIQAHPSDTLPQAKIYEIKDLLAQAYLDKAFRPNTSEEKLEALGGSVTALLPDINDGQSLWENILTICSIIRYEYKLKRQTELSTVWIKRIVRAGLELLSDSDEENDDSAYWLLARLFATVEDVENSAITITMRNMYQAQKLARWEDWVTTPMTSPLHRRSMIVQPMSDRLASTNGHSERKRSSSRGSGKGSTHAHTGEEAKEDKHIGTNNAVKENAGDLHERPVPAKISTEIAVDPVLDNKPEKPIQFVSCDGCDTWWTVMDEPLYSCADCLGHVQLDQKCHDLLISDQLNKRGLKCKKTHAFVLLPAWDGPRFKGMPKGCLPVPAVVSAEEGWIPAEEWKNRLKKQYLEDQMNGH
ncbi:hypothetical protein GGS20DRAFT_429972 [Poronia punctata]|nr:hypothetical protein GGS20DRAFT_429972 [Poronia punctata]